MERNYERKVTPRVGDESQFITINIPEENGVYTCHAHLAIHFSDYFRAALGVPMEEARTRSFTLSDPATDYTVSCFVSWVYAMASEKAHMGTYLRDVLGLDTPEKVIDTWLLADYLQATRLMDSLTMLLCRILRDKPEVLDIERQLARLPEGSGMWRLLIAFYAKLQGDPDTQNENGQAASSEALSAGALVEINRSLAAQLALSRSCVRQLDHDGYIRTTVRAEMKEVLDNGYLDSRQYLEANGSR